MGVALAVGVIKVNTGVQAWREAFIARMGTHQYVEALFDRMPDVVYSLKDRDGRYVYMSLACVHRCGLAHRNEAFGRTAFDLFPRPMAERYARQDEQLFRTGEPIVDSLDLTLYPDGSSGWCVSNKEPVRDQQGQVMGLACISKDLVEPSRSGMIDEEFAATMDYVRAHFAEPLRMEDLARRAGISLRQFEWRMKRIFHISAGQYLIKTRIDTAARMLAETDAAIAEIALATGFSDQSGLSRQFRQLTGCTPRQYRQLLRAGAQRASGV